ncbi:MAG: hypothetical protein PWQ79_2218, partial [Thermococcaceae archaeon]|nr:hypothetical protein [Thermococcaceae archaeon]
TATPSKNMTQNHLSFTEPKIFKCSGSYRLKNSPPLEDAHLGYVHGLLHSTTARLRSTETSLTMRQPKSITCSFHTITFYGNKKLYSMRPFRLISFHTITFYGNALSIAKRIYAEYNFPHDYVLRKLRAYAPHPQPIGSFHTITFYGNLSLFSSD